MPAVAFYAMLVVIKKSIQVIVANADSAQRSDRIDKIRDFLCRIHRLTPQEDYSTDLFACQRSGKNYANAGKISPLLYRGVVIYFSYKEVCYGKIQCRGRLLLLSGMSVRLSRSSDHDGQEWGTY